MKDEMHVCLETCDEQSVTGGVVSVGPMVMNYDEG